MKKNINIIMISILLYGFIFIPSAFASTEITDRVNIKVDGEIVYKIYDDQIIGKTNIVGGSGGIVKVNIDGEIFDGYCIDFGMNLSAGSSADILDLDEYFKSGISETKAKELTEKIILYAKYGYGSQGKTDAKYYLATQQLIWQAINDSGFYQSDFYEERAGRKYNLENIGWTTNKENKIDISNEIRAIRSAVNSYYTAPSFCSSQNKIEIEVGETAEYTDNNNVLSQYNVTCENGITCKTSGNKLTVTAKENTGSYKISFLKPESGTENVVYRSGSEQGIIVNKGKLAQVFCEFGIDTYKNVQTSDVKIVYVIIIGISSAAMAYIAYYTKKSLEVLK